MDKLAFNFFLTGFLAFYDLSSAGSFLWSQGKFCEWRRVVFWREKKFFIEIAISRMRSYIEKRKGEGWNDIIQLALCRYKFVTSLIRKTLPCHERFRKSVTATLVFWEVLRITNIHLMGQLVLVDFWKVETDATFREMARYMWWRKNQGYAFRASKCKA